MNWYNQSGSRFVAKNMIKTASSSPSISGDNQEGLFISLFDMQRYVMDAYSIKTSMSTTNRNIKIAIMINHAFLGSIGWDEYWSYDLNEKKKAKKTFDKINNVIKTTIEEFVKEEIPTSIFCPAVRAKIEELDKGAVSSTNIPSVNYSRRYKLEPDWRSNIYGTRYPKYSEPSYDQIVKFRGTQT